MSARAKARPRQHGFTLLELMIVLAIIAVLLAVGLPYTRAWVDSNRQLQARNVLTEAVAQTRALAMRNPGGITDTSAAALLKLSGHTIEVENADGSQVLWSGTVPTNATFKLADGAGLVGAALGCVAFDNRGQRLPSASGCTTPTAQYRVAVGFNTQEPVYVELL